MTRLALRSYYAMPVWAQNLALSAYGLRLRFLRYGAYHARVLEELLRSQWFSRDEVHNLQLNRLNAMLHHAATTVPFYRERGLPDRVAGLEDVLRLPLVRKTDLRGRERAFISSDPDARATVEIHTGGTTGTPLTIHCSRRVLQRNYAFFGRLLRWARVPSGARVATFAGRALVPPHQARPPYWRFNHASNTMLMSSYHLSPATLDAYVQQLRWFRPELIDSYPSSVEPIARRILRLGVRDVHPRAVLTSSETLYPDVRDAVRQAFGCEMFDYYGAAEMAAFISQCEAGSYHVNPEFGLVEVLVDGKPAAPGETGEMVATGFINPVMPLIRYVTGDLAVQGPAEICACGRAFPRVERIIGRMDDVLITPEGRRIGRLDPIFKAGGSLVEARVVQDAADHVRLEVVPDVGYGPSDETTLREELQRRLGPSVRVDVVRVAALPRTAGGKLRMVVREVGGEVAN